MKRVFGCWEIVARLLHFRQTINTRAAQSPFNVREDWQQLPTFAKGSTSTAEGYYPPEELERQRENNRRATEYATAYMAAEFEKAKERRERRISRP